MLLVSDDPQQGNFLATALQREKVNVEVDLLGKIVEKQVLGALKGNGEGGGSLIEKIVRRVLAEK